MATKPAKTTLNASSVDILNAVRAEATENYRSMVPRAAGNVDSVRAIGQAIMSYQPLQNEFLSALYNRIGRVILTSKLFNNPWGMFKKGLLEFGETVEEIFVNIARPHEYDVEVAETEWMKREIPDVRAAFHTLNYRKFYKATIENEQLRQAFLSWDGVTDLIAGIVDQLYNACNYDEFQTMKYMLGSAILAGNLYPVAAVPQAGETQTHATTLSILSESNLLTFQSTKYNVAGVLNASEKNNQYLIINGRFAAEMNLDVLATAFNMDKAEFMGHMVLVDDFGAIDTARLALLFKDDPTYVEISQADLTLLSSIPAVLVDRDFFMIFDNLQKFTEDYNGQGLYWQYWFHAWRTFSYSPFANAVVFAPGTPTVTAVTVTPATATLAPGSTLQLSVEVTGDNFPQKAVTWSTDSEYATVSVAGELKIATNAPSGTSIVVTARSNFDTTKSGKSTITIS